MGEHRDRNDGDRAAWIRVLDESEAEGRLAGLYRKLGFRERVPHVIGLHSLHPSALEAHVRLYRTLMFGPSPLSRAERETIAVVVSAANDCFY